MTKKERQAMEYFNELAEGVGTMVEPGQSVNTQKDWKYHTAKLRGVELDSLPEGWGWDNQLNKIRDELYELGHTKGFSTDTADECFDVTTGCMTLMKMLRIDIEEANRKHCAKMESRFWKARY